MAYTWSKALTEGSAYNYSPKDSMNIHGDYGPASFNQPKIFVASSVYPLPFWRHERVWYKRELGDWQLSGVTRISSGLPINPVQPTGVSTAGNLVQTTTTVPQRVNLVGNACAHGGKQYLTPAGFAIPSAGSYGNVEYDGIKGPLFNNWGAALQKNIPIHESIGAEFRAEMFDIPNHLSLFTIANTFGSSNFGQATAATDPRTMDFVLRIHFKECRDSCRQRPDTCELVRSVAYALICRYPQTASTLALRNAKRGMLKMTPLYKCALSATCVAVTAMWAGNAGLGAQTPTPVPARARPVSTVGSQGPMPTHATFTASQIESGGGLFLQNCAFCHGKDAGGGESGPDLTRSKLVGSDNNGEAIGAVVRNGRPEKGMPRFSLSDGDVLSLVAFVHSQQDKAMSQTGTRKGVDESDLRTGNAQKGKEYFDGVGGCVKCHSASGDLAGVATRYTGLKLEQQMLYPADVKAKLSVKTRTGETLTGTLDSEDEFTIGMHDSLGEYHSWPTAAVIYHVDRPLDAHVAAMARYTDDDIHNVLAYLQTLK